jgi:hypothetical protein
VLDVRCALRLVLRWRQDFCRKQDRIVVRGAAWMLRLVLSRRTEGQCGLHAMQWRAAPSRLESLSTSIAAVITNLLALFHLSLRGTDGCGDVRDRGAG